MRLLFASLNFAPELTATGKYTGEMAEWFAARGHLVHAIAGLPHYPEWSVREDYRARWFTREKLNGVIVLRAPHYVPAPRRVTGRGRVLMECTFSLSSLYWWLGILLRRARYDAVVAVCPPMQTALMPWVYRLARRVPTVFHIQDFQVDAAIRLGVLNPLAFGRLLYWMENLLLKHSDRVSTITPAMRRRAEQKGASPDKIWVVPNWADLEQIVPSARMTGFRRDLAVGDDETLVMYAGAMGRKQGLDVLLDAAELLRGRSRIHFVLVGNGADRPRLIERIEAMELSNVRILPVQPAERLPEMLAAADVHLIIQRSEAADIVMPSKLTNILAAGRPAIATADKGTALWEVLEGAGTGCCVPPGDPSALAERVLRVAEDHEGRERMGRAARAYAEANLSQDFILERFEEKLLELAKGSKVR